MQVVGVTGVVSLLNPSISASLAGFALAFASTITGDVGRSYTCSEWTADHHTIL